METSNKTILIAGGNGFLGQLLTNHFVEKGHRVISLNRQASTNNGQLKRVKWDGKTAGEWIEELNHTDVLINLVGKSVDCRYTEENKKEIFDSRLHSTKVLGEAIQQAKTPPKLWINASSATIYRHSIEKEMNETDGEIGQGFSVEVCKQWEAMAKQYDNPITRQVLLRTSMVMGTSGGVFPVLSKLVKAGLGGKQGKGSQFMSWIHATDFIRSIEWIIKYPELSGSVNCTAPTPLTNAHFMRLLRKSFKVPFGLPANKLMLEVGAFFLRTETELVLKSRNVVPDKLLKSGFKFKYPTAEEAIQQLSQQNK